MPPTLRVVEQANAIIREYLAQGFALTLRQLFYQFVARALLENLFNEYERLGRIVRDARDGGLIDWDAIEDRTREVNTHTFWTNRQASSGRRRTNIAKTYGQVSAIDPRCGLRKRRCSALSKVFAPNCGCPTSPTAATTARRCSIKQGSASPNIWTKA